MKNRAKCHDKNPEIINILRGSQNPKTAPYANEEDFCEAIEIVAEAIQNYKPEEYGLAYAFDAAPRFNFGAFAQAAQKWRFPWLRVSKSLACKHIT